MVEVQVRIKNYLKEFLVGMYNSDVITASRNNIVGLSIIKLLEQPPKISEREKLTTELEDLTDAIDNSISLSELDNLIAHNPDNQSVIYQKIELLKMIARKNIVLKKINTINCFETSCNREILRVLLKSDASYNYQSDNYISIENQIFFESVISELFNNMFNHFIADRMSIARKMNVRIQIKDSIFQFCNDYNISFNKTNYETLKKKYYRWEQNKQDNNNKKNKVIVPVSSRAFTAHIFSNTLTNQIT